MFGYFDESIVYLNGKRYLCLGLAVYKEKCREDVIRREAIKFSNDFKNVPEIKYINVRNERLKNIILDKVKENVFYFDYEILEIDMDRNVHVVVNLLIEVLLYRFENQYFRLEKNGLKKLDICYDKATYEFDFERIYKYFPYIKKFDLVNSKSEFGIQNVDWLVGDAAYQFKKNQ